MNNQKHSSVTAFYLETLLLIVVFLSILLVLTNIFGLGRSFSSQAKQENAAVTLAQNAAELARAAESPTHLMTLLGGEEADFTFSEQSAGVTLVQGAYDMDLNADPKGALQLEVRLSEEERAGGTWVYCDIAVSTNQKGTTVYTLDADFYRED